MMIVPAIIPTSLLHLRDSLARVQFAPAVQIDVVDGKFVKSVSWPYAPLGSVMEAADLLTDRRTEIDLMVADPLAAGRQWLRAGAAALVFHLESVADFTDVLVLRDEYTFELGMAIGNDTPLKMIDPHLGNLDYVQLMGIAEIGAQGAPFDPRTLERIATLRNAHPRLTISIDGAVSAENILALREAGADRFAVGSAIMQSSDPAATYEELLKIVST